MNEHARGLILDTFWSLERSALVGSSRSINWE